MPSRISQITSESHRLFLQRLIEVTKTDARIVGVAIGGSYLTNSIDEYSDLDLVLAIEPKDYVKILAERKAIAATLGKLLAAFTGEHVGEPRLLVCLYDEPLLHVDLKFVSLDDVSIRVEDPAILLDKEGRLRKALEAGKPEYPSPDRQWIEDRFWAWVHYVLVKIGRGELFEAIESLSFFRTYVLGPLALLEAGVRATGVRRIEVVIPEFASELRKTIARYDVADCMRALRVTIELYRSLRGRAGNIVFLRDAERAVINYFTVLENRFGLTDGFADRIEPPIE
jgi:predicted nucleotidyltransferase